MEITFNCPNCKNSIQTDVVETKTSIDCPSCQKNHPLTHFPNENPKELRQCPLCTAKDLYVQKKFPKKLGLAIVIVAGIITLLWDHKYYFTLMATALIDFWLYQRCPNVQRCYQCESEYGNTQILPDRTSFDLNIFERYRQNRKN